MLQNKDHFHELRKFENIHIPLWLIKDTCWMMEWKTMGITMIFPTILVAIIITMKSFRKNEFFINLAICFWITANAYWMCCEFMEHIELKNFAAIPFFFGFIATGIFYFRKMVLDRD